MSSPSQSKTAASSVDEVNEDAASATASVTSSNSAVPKTPVSLLQELYIRRGVTPKYDLVQIEGAVHEPTFKYRVTVGEFVATGTGQSKKKAKHTAAKAVLEKIRQCQIKIQGKPAPLNGGEAGITALPDSTSNAAPASGGSTTVALKYKNVPLPDLEVDLISPYDDGIEGNPVGELQELCMNRRMAPPIYEVCFEEGQPHERSFIIDCKVGKQRETGRGKSKKMAKRQSAFKMLKRLQTMPVDHDPNKNAIIDEDELVLALEFKNKLSRDAKQSGKLHFDQILYKKKKPISPDSKLGGLLRMSLEDMRTGDPVKILDEVGDEMNVAVTFVEIDEKSTDEKFHTLVQIGLQPTVVCYGVEETREASKFECALHSLQYLKVMLTD